MKHRDWQLRIGGPSETRNDGPLEMFGIAERQNSDPSEWESPPAWVDPSPKKRPGKSFKATAVIWEGETG